MASCSQLAAAVFLCGILTVVGCAEVSGPAVRYTEEGVSVVLECEGEGVLAWRQGGEVVRNGTQYSVSGGRLEILNVESETTGYDMPYVCEGNGSQSDPVFIIIQRPLPVPSDLSLVFRDGTLCVDWRGPLPPNATFQVEFSEDPPTLTNTTANSLHKTLLPRPLNISVRVRVATALATGNWSASQSLHLPGEPATPTAGPDDSTMSIVTATIIGTLGFAVLNLLLTCALLYCYYQKDRGTDLDPVEYSVEEQYEARVDPQALARLDPEVRGKLDLGLLARIAHTDREVLEKFQYEAETSNNQQQTVPVLDLDASLSLSRPSARRTSDSLLHTTDRDSANLPRPRSISDVTLASLSLNLPRPRSISDVTLASLSLNPTLRQALGGSFSRQSSLRHTTTVSEISVGTGGPCTPQEDGDLVQIFKITQADPNPRQTPV